MIRGISRTLLFQSFPSRIRPAHRQLLFNSRYLFVNIPITSSYYHTQLPISIQPALHLSSKEAKLNEKVYLLQHAAEIVLKDPKVYTNSVRKTFITQLKLWEGSSRGRFQRIATVAWIIEKLGLQDQLRSLYEEIVQRVDDDEWYVNFDESMKALEAFTGIPDGQLKDRVYEKIERNLGLTLSDVNMSYYQRICLALLAANRVDSEMWEKLEEFVLRNLSMEYTPKMFMDIFKAFAISRNGSDTFYQVSQQIIFKGHLYSRFHFLRSNLGDYDANGQFFALLAETYAIVKQYTPFLLDPEFLDYMYKSMTNSRLEYRQISSVSRLLKALPQIGFDEDEVETIIQDVLAHKTFHQYASIGQIRELFQLLAARYGKVPTRLLANIESLVGADIKRKLLPPSMAIQIVNLLLSCRQPDAIGSSALIPELSAYLDSRIKYLRPGEIEELRQCLEESVALSGQLEASRSLLPHLR